MQTPALSTPNNIQTGAQSAVLRLTKSHLAQNSKHQPARPPHGARQCKASLHANDDWKPAAPVSSRRSSSTAPMPAGSAPSRLAEWL
jgi:hypothetical protein